MALTNPRLVYPVTVPTGGQEITIRYVGGTPADETVTLAAGTYYATGDGSSEDLLEKLKDALNGNANGVTFSVVANFGTGSFGNNGRLAIAASHGSYEVSELEFTTTNHLGARDFGFSLLTPAVAPTIGPFTTGGSNVAGASYRMPSVWIPDSPDYAGVATQKNTAVVQALGPGGGDADLYQGPKEWEHVLYEVSAVLVRAQYASDADYVGRVTDLTSGDVWASLEGWLGRYQELLGGALPQCRWVPDWTSPSPRSVYLQAPELIAGVEGWITNTNLGPDWHDLRLTLVEVV